VRALALLVTLTGAVAGTSALAAAPASAAQSNQEWFGSNDGILSSDYSWRYLGGPIAWAPSVQIHTANGGRCLDLNGNNFFSWPMNNGWPLNSTQLQLWDCKAVLDGSAANQRWTQQDNGDGSWTYYVSSWYNGQGARPYCLDSLGGHHYDGSPVEVWACDPSQPNPSQRWTIGPQGQLQSVDSPGFCADATNWGSWDGTPIQLWSCAY
jgi:hypothetical protein